MMDSEQKQAARRFAEYWKNKGYEKGGYEDYRELKSMAAQLAECLF